MGKKKRLKLERAQQEAKKPQERLPLSLGVIVFSVLLFLSSLVQMNKLVVDRDWYFDIYSYMPAWLVVARYSFSWSQRIFGLLAAFGLFFRMEMARKLAFIIGAFTILTVYWKHPYAAVHSHVQFLDQKFGQYLELTGTGVTFSSLTPLAVAALIALDVIFWVIFFVFFTRPSIRKQFKPDA